MKQGHTEQKITDAFAMEPQEISIEVLQEKYAKNDEKTIQDIRRRVARDLACTSRHIGK